MGKRGRSRRLYLYRSSPWTVDRAGRMHGTGPGWNPLVVWRAGE
jgi:hypothetical protein